ncbi:PQQ-dependent sugar dehydrogenase [Sphingomonas sp. BGYR3]|uniref:PQQ-dependent sugar dehydrogenase n=1 Tax=Sphingomonas sp. BGYR3 TaxID=2975483 RepID=UPI0021A54A14|nr:PQQ-dependent sugar dehydrogenase [Sphingomonas sp. BGYR3]MDG5489452.1 PQQ-dependent sugar dehydrogenase [Sphingomonas sp. BGYR3]
MTAACGGGGSGGSAGVPAPAPPPANRAPAFTSATSASVAENSVGVVYRAAATDADGDTVTFTLAGDDASRFALTLNGELAFLTPPDFDEPGDANFDNEYRLTLTASDGRATTAQILTVTVTNLAEGIAVRRIDQGLTNITAIAPINETELLIGDRGGAVSRYNLQTGAVEPLVQIGNIAPDGLLAITPTNRYPADGSFFAMYLTPQGSLIVNWYLRNPAGPYVPSNFGPVLAQPAQNYRGGGWLGRDGPDGVLALIGDAELTGAGSSNAQNDQSWLGKLLRIAPNPDPYAGATISFFTRSIVARGIKSPNGGAAFNGALIFADAATTGQQEVNFYTPGTGGRNFGWPFREGTTVIGGTPPANLVDPVIRYQAAVLPGITGPVIGGAMGPRSIASIADHYVFADASGAIFSAPADRLNAATPLLLTAVKRRTADFTPNLGTINSPRAIVNGTDGSVLILDSDGELFIVPAS